MRAILDRDIIIKILPKDTEGGIEIGNLPLGVPFDTTRLRWNGIKLVDLTTFDAIHVERKQGIWTLHCVEVPGSQLVTMKFWQRKYLIDDAGTYRILTVEEIVEKKEAKKAFTLDNRRLRAELKEMVQDLTFDNIDTHIDNVWSNLNTAQKNSLKKLFKVTLLLAKQQVRERS